MRKSARECSRAQGPPLCKCHLIHFSCICPAVTPQALLSSTSSKAPLSLRQTSPATPAELGSPLNNSSETEPGCSSPLTSTPRTAYVTESHYIRRSPRPVCYDRASVVHSNPVERHLLPTCRGGSPVRVRRCVCVCVWLVSHAATVIHMSAVCLSARPDSDSDDLTAEWLVVCFCVSRVVCRSVFVCACVLLAKRTCNRFKKKKKRFDSFASKCHPFCLITIQND